MNSEFLGPLGFAAAFFSGLMMVAWGAAMRLKFLSLVDAVWALGIGVCAAALALAAGARVDRAVFAAVLALCWSLRLGGYLAIRLARHFPVEDPRYLALRAAWGRGFLWKTFLFFQAQALTQTLFIFPFLGLVLDPAPFPRWNEIFGALLALGGLLGESIADSQLARFKADPLNRGRVCNVGLWRWSRHPNYFFEWLVWCGFAVCAVQAPLGLLAVASPVVMLFLLLFVTGVRPSEEQSLKNRGDLYREYQRTTSAFVPWFAKKV